MISNCCNKGMYVNSSKEGTSYFICEKCHKACDPFDLKKEIKDVWLEGLQYQESIKKGESYMKPFDIEAAKRGDAVITRDGRNVRIICFDRNDDNHHMPIVSLIRDEGTHEDIYCYRKNGKFYIDEDSPGDLFMAKNKVKGWIAIAKSLGGSLVVIQNIYKSRDDVLKDPYMKEIDLVDLVEIEFEI